MKISRQEATRELEKRGYKRDEEFLGVWVSPDGAKIAWFIALRREGIEFDSSTWGEPIQQIKKKMARQKKKKEKGIKWFPGYDLYITAAIAVVVGSAMILKACQ